MKHLWKLIAVSALSAGLGACARSAIKSGATDAAVMTANYTDDYVNFTLKSQSGKNLGIGGDATPFSKGGTGGLSCCAMLPSVGQAIRVELNVGGFNDSADQYKPYSENVIVKGAVSADADRHSYLIIRIFAHHEIEAELVPGDDPRGMKNPRVDQLFIGRHVMRKLGE